MAASAPMRWEAKISHSCIEYLGPGLVILGTSTENFLRAVHALSPALALHGKCGLVLFNTLGIKRGSSLDVSNLASSPVQNHIPESNPPANRPRQRKQKNRAKLPRACKQEEASGHCPLICCHHPCLGLLASNSLSVMDTIIQDLSHSPHLLSYPNYQCSAAGPFNNICVPSHPFCIPQGRFTICKNSNSDLWRVLSPQVAIYAPYQSILCFLSNPSKHPCCTDCKYFGAGTRFSFCIWTTTRRAGP